MTQQLPSTKDFDKGLATRKQVMGEDFVANAFGNATAFTQPIQEFITRNAWGVPVVTHGGTLLGYHSNWWALPDSGIGAVVLTNSDPGAALLAPFFRRLLEILYDGRPEAMQEVTAAAARIKAQAVARRARLTLPGDPAVLGDLGARYASPGIGSITISNRDGGKWVKAGSIVGPLATRKNADGSVSIVSVGPGGIGLDALVGKAADGARTLTVRDAQHEYVYTEVK